MPMTDDEWAAISLILATCWPGEFTEAAETAWRAMLGDEDPAATLIAVKTIAPTVQHGFRPSVGDVLRELRRDPDEPDFAEAFEVIYGRGGVLRQRTKVRKGIWDAGEREELDQLAQLDFLNDEDEVHPKIRAFALEQTLSHLRREAPVRDDEDGHNGARRHRLERSWEEFSERYTLEGYRALATGRERRDLRKPFAGELES
jgi:hypothetical protein